MNMINMRGGMNAMRGRGGMNSGMMGAPMGGMGMGMGMPMGINNMGFPGTFLHIVYIICCNLSCASSKMLPPV